MNVNERFEQLLDELAHEKFVASHVENTDPQTLREETLGILVAQTCRWDGNGITRTYLHALEDANFHSFYGKAQELYEREENAVLFPERVAN